MATHENISGLAGEILIRKIVPPDIEIPKPLDAKNISALCSEIAKKYPDKFPDISLKLSNLGALFSYVSGGPSFTLDDVRPTYELDNIRKEVEAGVEKILDDPKLTQKEKEDKIIEFVSKYDDVFLENTVNILKQRGFALASQIASGSRGKPVDARRILTGDVLYVDHRGEPIPIPVLRGFVSSLTPAQYWTSGYGARRGWVLTNLGTADAGYLSKQLTNAAHDLVVVATDAPHSDKFVRGIPVDVNDPDNVGAFLATDVNGYKKNTVLTNEILADLQTKGIKEILIRSVIARRAPNGGIYARDAGLFENGRELAPGDMVGIIASQAVGEPITQMVIGAKHSGGTKKTDINIDSLIQFLQAPSTYRGSVHASVSGTVTRIEDAPAGGKFVYVNNTPHYVSPHLDIVKQKGDTVEEGDMLTSGIPNPAKLVLYKGIGEGRRLFMETLRDIYKKTGFNIRRRNFEILAAGLVNHVKFTAPYGNYLPGDVVKYSWIESKWMEEGPREGSKIVPVDSAVGKYLEYPVLHYTIGTKILPSFVNTLKKFGITSIIVNDNPPPFIPFFSPAEKIMDYEQDWLVRFLGGVYGQKRSLLRAAQEAHATSMRSTSFVPSLVSGQGFATEWPKVVTNTSRV